MGTHNKQNSEKIAEQDGQVDAIVLRSILEKWNTEMDKLWDEWQWCLEHKFQLDAVLKYELKEQLRRKISELRDILK